MTYTHIMLQFSEIGTGYSCDCVCVYESAVHLLISDLVLISLNVTMWDCTELKTMDEKGFFKIKYLSES